MADFNKSYALMQKWENRVDKQGNLIVYSNDPLDKGGETVFGISRKANPQWEGWTVLDKLKAGIVNPNPLSLSKTIIASNAFSSMVKGFYKKNYFDAMWLLHCIHQPFADNIFLLGVNAGIKRAIKVAQRAGGLIADGVIGEKTIDLYLKAGDKETKRFTELEIEYYKSIVEKDPSQEKYLKGWINRAKAV